jgi:hypothetical protein
MTRGTRGDRGGLGVQLDRAGVARTEGVNPEKRESAGPEPSDSRP